MSSFRNEAKREFLNTMQAIVLEGRFRDWLLTMILLAIPIAIALNLSAFVDSLTHTFLAPMIVAPSLKSIAISDLAAWRIGEIPIGAFVSDVINICFNLMILFGLTRFLRRSI